MNKYAIYRIMRQVLPRRLQKSLAGSSKTQLLRDWFFRPTGVPELIEGSIKWEDLQFDFAAPYQTYYKAQNRGVENTICRLARAVLKDSEIALDVGANYGFITLVMARSVQPNGRIVSFEVDPFICSVLNRTIEKNRLSENVILVPRGAGKQDSVESVTIDTVLNEYQLRQDCVNRYRLD